MLDVSAHNLNRTMLAQQNNEEQAVEFDEPIEIFEGSPNKLGPVTIVQLLEESCDLSQESQLINEVEEEKKIEAEQPESPSIKVDLDGTNFKLNELLENGWLNA